MHDRYNRIFPATLVLAAGLALLGFLLDSPEHILPGLYRIITMQDLLITDYVEIAGPGFINFFLIVCFFKLHSKQCAYLVNVL